MFIHFIHHDIINSYYVTMIPRGVYLYTNIKLDKIIQIYKK